MLKKNSFIFHATVLSVGMLGLVTQIPLQAVASSLGTTDLAQSQSQVEDEREDNSAMTALDNIQLVKEEAESYIAGMTVLQKTAESETNAIETGAGTWAAELRTKESLEKALPAKKIQSETLQKQNTSMRLSSSELNCLQRIVQAEAGTEDLVGKILVANVVLNRYESEDFPDTIEEAVTQTHIGSYGLVYQFTPTKPNGSYWSVVPSEETIEAVSRALAGEDYSEGALYFAARQAADARHMSWFDRNLTWLFRHGSHEFYKE